MLYTFEQMNDNMSRWDRRVPLKDDLKQLVFVGTGGLVVASFEGKQTTKHDDQQTAFGEMFQRGYPALGFGVGCFYIDVFGH